MTRCSHTWLRTSVSAVCWEFNCMSASNSDEEQQQAESEEDSEEEVVEEKKAATQKERKVNRCGTSVGAYHPILNGKRNPCVYCRNNSAHPLFVYLLGIDSAKSGVETWTPKIGLSRNPYKRLQSHNRVRGHVAGGKSTQAGAPHWKLWLVVGPFTEKGSKLFVDRWTRESRKPVRRFSHGFVLTKQFNQNATSQALRVWCDSVLTRSIHAYLKEPVPVEFDVANGAVE